MGNDWLVMVKWNDEGRVPAIARNEPESTYDIHRNEVSSG